MTARDGDPALLALIAESDDAFAAGDADRWAKCFAADGHIFLLHREPMVGREAIREEWRAFARRFDASAWEPHTDVLEVHGDRAYAFRTYTERLLDRGDGSRTLVRGRLVYFLRRETSGDWRITLAMNSHSHPMEPIS